MSKGGKRPGAGRPKGSKNQRTAQSERLAARIMASGRDPVEYLLSVMEKDKDPTMRLEAAKAAAPYIRARLSSAEVTHRNPDDDLTEEEMLAKLDGLLLAKPELLAAALERNPGLLLKLKPSAPVPTVQDEETRH